MNPVGPKCVFQNVHATSNNHPFDYIGFDQAAEGLDEGSDVDLFFSLKGSTLRKIPSFLSLHQPRTSHEYYLCILAMFMMSRKDIKHVNWPSLGVLNLCVLKCETRWEGAVKR